LKREQYYKYNKRTFIFRYSRITLFAIGSFQSDDGDAASNGDGFTEIADGDATNLSYYCVESIGGGDQTNSLLHGLHRMKTRLR